MRRLRQYRIRLRITVELPETLPLSDTETCSIVGNIFDNAINACKEVPETERRIDLTISCPTEVRFGIVASNSFSGQVRMDGDRYLSTHPGGSGIGLASISSIARRHHGTATFRHEDKTFISGVLLPMEKIPTHV